MLADLAVGKRALGEQLYEKWARHIQDLGCLDGGELQILRNSGRATTGGHSIKDINKQRYGSGRQFKRLLLFGINDKLGQRPGAIAITRKTLPGHARQIGFLCRWRRLNHTI